MTGSINSRQENRRQPMTLWGWVMLLVVVLSSAPSAAQPRTRLVGSAFDPSATAVVVSPKRTRLNASTALPAPRKLPEDGAPNGGVAIVWTTVQIAGSHCPQAIRARQDGLPPERFRLTRVHGPRAPPHAEAASAEGRAVL